MLLTHKYRVKDATAGKRLAEMARAVNQVWNYCGVIHNDSRRHGKRWPGFTELCRLTAGSTKLLGLHSDTIQDVVKHWVRARDKARKRPRWRASQGSKRALGWVPFQTARAIKVNGNTITMLGQDFRVWLSRPIPENIRSGSFSQDATGKWFINLFVEVDEVRPMGDGEVGIDLGLKDFATMSTGGRVENPRHIHKSAVKLARAQRAGRKALARKIHRKVAAQRRHFLHEESAKIAKANALIVVGDVDSAALARTKMAKSVLDAGWSAFRSMLRYKAMRHGAVFLEVNERYSTQTCSHCGAVGGPKGLKGLRVREWECESCGTVHDRDVNAARNILRSGQNIALQQTEIPAL